jgi:DNA-binding response OmpR family regulator
MSQQILVVEDDAFLAMTLVMDLEDAGYSVVGPFMTVAKALVGLAANTVDFGILDMNLGDETSEAVADALTKSDIPFVVASGYTEDRMTGAFKGAPTLSKPYLPEDLFALLPAN